VLSDEYILAVWLRETKESTEGGRERRSYFIWGRYLSHELGKEGKPVFAGCFYVPGSLFVWFFFFFFGVYIYIYIYIYFFFFSWFLHTIIQYVGNIFIIFQNDYYHYYFTLQMMIKKSKCLNHLTTFTSTLNPGPSSHYWNTATSSSRMIWLTARSCPWLIVNGLLIQLTFFFLHHPNQGICNLKRHFLEMLPLHGPTA